MNRRLTVEEYRAIQKYRAAAAMCRIRAAMYDAKEATLEIEAGEDAQSSGLVAAQEEITRQRGRFVDAMDMATRLMTVAEVAA